MTSSGRYLARYEALKAQRAYSRDIAARGISALLAPYRVVPVPVVPSQRRRVLRSEVTA